MQSFSLQPGFWLASLLVLLMAVNALRTVVNPTGFSRYMGLPITDDAGVAWVRVYGLRAMFIGAVAAYFLVRLDAASLQWLAAFAAPMAIGDAWLVHRAGGAAVRRHLVIACVAVLSTVAIHRWSLAA